MSAEIGSSDQGVRSQSGAYKETDLSAYLAQTPFCDFQHPTIQEILQDVISGGENEVEKARKIFFYARDKIRFALMGSGIDSRASQTAQIGYGDCGTKTNFHIALLRAVGIPARMRGIMAKIEVLKGMIPGWLYALVSPAKVDYHFWPECYLGGRWIACEGLFDQALYKGALAQGLIDQEIISEIDWDGTHNLILLEPWRTEDFGVKSSWDEWYVDFKKHMPTPKVVDQLMSWTVAPACRRQTDRIRRQGQLISQ